jgi:hypothetical protein
VIYHVWCNTCRSWGRSIEPAEVIARFGQDMLAIDVEQHLRCSRCRQNDAEMKVAPKRTNGQ